MCEHVKTGIAWNNNIKMSYPRWSVPCGRPDDGGTCPFATPECLKHCYGNACYPVDPERIAREVKAVYPGVLQHDRENLDFTRRRDFIARMVASLQHERPAIFRIHERGDFYGIAYFRAWCEIARQCPDTRFFAFTKAFHLFKRSRPANFVLIASMFYDEKRPRPRNVPAFYTVPVGNVGPGTHCHGSCDNCGICPYAEGNVTVWSEVH